jgi:pimeloyl-ACP methyl ester carboxylesterase
MLQQRSQSDAVQESRVEAAGAWVRVLTAGPEDAPPLVLIHGLGMSADYWTAYTFPALAASYRLIALDLPGFGRSGGLPRFTLAAYSAVVRGLIAQVAPGRRVHLLGHSMGGQISIAVAAHAPEQIRSLTLVGSAGLPWREAPWRVPLRAAFDRCNYQPRLLRYGFQARPLGRSYRECLAMILAEAGTTEALLPRITAPTLLVWGENDYMVPLRYGRTMARLLPNARLAVGRGLSHVPFFQRPAAFHRLVADFLQEHE